MAETLAIVALLGLALALAGLLFERLRLSPAVGYLAIGMLAAPATFGKHLVPEDLIHGAAELGVLFLLFLIGIELDLKRLREALRSTAWVIPFDIAVPAAAVAIVARLSGWTVGQAIAAGITVAISSTLFGDRLTRQPGTERGVRKRVLGVLISEDVAAGFLLALLVVIAGGAGLGGADWFAPATSVARLLFLMLLLTAAALIVVPRTLDAVAKRHVPELVLLWAIGLIVLGGFFGNLAGSAELGALLVGVAAAESGSRYVVRNALHGLRDIALAIFFFASGLAVDVFGAAENILLVFAVAVVFLIAKTLVHAPAAIASGLNMRGGLQVAFSLGTIGEFTLILVAVAEKEGLAHPAHRTVVVGAMVLLLLVSGILNRSVPSIERGYAKLPDRVRGPLGWIVRGLGRSAPAEPDTGGRKRKALRQLASNALLLLALGLAAVALRSRVQPWLQDVAPFWGPVVGLGFLLAIAAPLATGAYRGYRDLVWLLVGLRPGERAGAGRVRARLVDAWTAATAFVLLIFLAIRIPETLPVVFGAGLVALTVGTVAWRQLNRFHRTLEGSLSRVLGEDEEAASILDRVMQQYPWGVRFAAVAVPPRSPVVGRTIMGSRLAELTGVMVAVIQRNRQEIVNPQADEKILSGDTLVLLGDPHQLGRAEALIVAHGEAIRLEAQSRSAVIEEVRVAASSPWVGRTLGSLNIRTETGTLVMGVLRGEGSHPRAFEPDWVIKENDALILMGTPLQIDRARSMATPEA